MSSMSVTCPPGFAPGAAFVVQDPNTGQQMQVVVPDGIAPGQTFQVQVPFSPPAPVPMAQPYAPQPQQYAPQPQQYAPQPQQYAPQPQQYAPQPQQYAPQPVAPQNVVVNMMQAPPQAPIIINNNNNNNNNNSMQMQGPTPQQMYTQGPRTGWHSGLFECANDIPVCASRPCCSPLRIARPRPARAHHARKIALHGDAPPHAVQ
jgi:hypothetical protein